MRVDPASVRRLRRLGGMARDRCGIALELVPTVCDAGHTRLRLHAPAARSGRPLVQALLRSLDRRGISLHPTTPVLQLWTDAAGTVVGVQVKRPRKAPSNVRCHKLILATGGFGANSAALAQHCRAAEGLRYAGHPGSSGEALVWGADVGAATRDLDAYDAHASVAVGSNLLIPWIVITAGALLVNQRGERFADETCGPAAMVPLFSLNPARSPTRSSTAASPRRWRRRTPGLPTKSFRGWCGAPTTSRAWQDSSKSIRRRWRKRWLPTMPPLPAATIVFGRTAFGGAAQRAVLRHSGRSGAARNPRGPGHRSERARSARRRRRRPEPLRRRRRSRRPVRARRQRVSARQRPPVRPGLGQDRGGAGSARDPDGTCRQRAGDSRHLQPRAKAAPAH